MRRDFWECFAAICIALLAFAVVICGIVRLADDVPVSQPNEIDFEAILEAYGH